MGATTIFSNVAIIVVRATPLCAVVVVFAAHPLVRQVHSVGPFTEPVLDDRIAFRGAVEVTRVQLPQTQGTVYIVGMVGGRMKKS